MSLLPSLRGPNKHSDPRASLATKKRTCTDSERGCTAGMQGSGTKELLSFGVNPPAKS